MHRVLYHFGPDVKQRFRDSLAGAIVAVMTWIGLSYLLGLYFRHFDSLDKTYGRSVPPLAYGSGFTFPVLPSCSVGKLTFCSANLEITALHNRSSPRALRSTI